MQDDLNHDDAELQQFAQTTGCNEAASSTAVNTAAGFILNEVIAD